MSDQRPKRYLAALVLASVAGCTSIEVAQPTTERLTVAEIISGHGGHDGRAFEITGRLYVPAGRSIFLTNMAHELSGDSAIPMDDECVQVATTEAQSRSLARYDGEVVTLIGSIVQVPVSSEAVLMTVTIKNKQQLHPHCQYPLGGGVLPIINLQSWKRP